MDKTMQTSCLSQTDTPTGENIIDQISIESNIMEIWLSAIADIAASLRYHKGVFRVIPLEDDRAVANQDGTLLLSAQVNGKEVKMRASHELWQPLPLSPSLILKHSIRSTMTN